jgi:hypothetical protein
MAVEGPPGVTLTKPDRASRRVPSNRRLAGIDIMRWNFGVKVMQQPVIRSRFRSKPVVYCTPVDEAQKALGV